MKRNNAEYYIDQLIIIKILSEIGGFQILNNHIIDDVIFNLLQLGWNEQDIKKKIKEIFKGDRYKWV